MNGSRSAPTTGGRIALSAASTAATSTAAPAPPSDTPGDDPRARRRPRRRRPPRRRAGRAGSGAAPPAASRPARRVAAGSSRGAEHRRRRRGAASSRSGDAARAAPDLAWPAIAPTSEEELAWLQSRRRPTRRSRASRRAISTMLENAVGLREAHLDATGLDPRTFALVEDRGADRARRPAGVLRLAGRQRARRGRHARGPARRAARRRPAGRRARASSPPRPS